MRRPTAIIAASTFPVDPPRGGGQLRLLHLCRALASLCPVEIVALAGDEDSPSTSVLAPGLREHRIPKTSAHVRAELELEQQAGIPVTDIAFADLHRLTPEFLGAVRGLMRPGATVLACHPYTLPVLAAAAPDAALLYDAQDVAVDLKTSMLRPTTVAAGLLETTRTVERACCARAQLVLPVSRQDAARLQDLYGVAPERIAVTPNGVDCAAVRFTAPSKRRDIRRRLGFTRPQALFLGSWHEPNLAAVRHVIHLAAECSEVDFLIAGSACLPFRDTELPANLTLLGVVSDGMRNSLLAMVDVALNPISSGSGSNIKMLDYLAAGVPVVSTEIGARGLDLDEQTVGFAGLPEFPQAIERLLAAQVDALNARARAGRDTVEQRFDWLAIGRRLCEQVAALRDAHSAGASATMA